MSDAPALRRFVRVHPFLTRYLEPLRAALLEAFPGTTWEERHQLPEDDPTALCFAYPGLLGDASPSVLRRTIVELRDTDPSVGDRLLGGQLAGVIVDRPEGPSLLGLAHLLRPDAAPALTFFLLPGHPVDALAGSPPALDYVRALAAAWPT